MTHNYADAAGKKQGIWKSYLNGKLWKEENFKDNVLHGKSKVYNSDGAIQESHYFDGQLHGLILDYYPDSTSAHYAAYYEQDKHVWTAYPWELESYIVPVKGFHSSKDTVEISVPYNSGKTMYVGT
ncbi:MAG: toxin-antitoxin system YwqK family antitoxin, partial [Flavobacteriales bacterium]